MYKKILVPLDGSELAELVLPYAKEIGNRLGLELILLHVCDPEKPESKLMCQGYIEYTAEMIRKQLKEVLISAPGKSQEIKVTGKLTEGRPAEEIINYARENNIDIILMASHGRSGIKRWVLGSVADKVLQASPIPIWLVRANILEQIIHDKWPGMNLLVPLDGSKLAESVIPHLEALAKQFGPEMVNVVLLRVCEEPKITADYPEVSMKSSWKEHVNLVKECFKQEAEKYLQGICEQLSGAGLKASAEVHMGNPADTIIGYIDKHPPVLVVIASHGYSGVSRWAYGSVADKIIHGVSNPIFLVRMKQSG
jgi:nucleotide-binding universal stress UspA family protein